jgi:hypothetical protein
MLEIRLFMCGSEILRVGLKDRYVLIKYLPLSKGFIGERKWAILSNQVTHFLFPINYNIILLRMKYL